MDFGGRARAFSVLHDGPTGLDPPCKMHCHWHPGWALRGAAARSRGFARVAGARAFSGRCDSRCNSSNCAPMICHARSKQPRPQMQYCQHLSQPLRTSDHSWRLSLLAAHLRTTEQSWSVLTSAAARKQTQPHDAASATETEVSDNLVHSELLSDTAMAAFVRDGFVRFQLDGLPAEWHESVAAAAREVHDMSPGNQQAIWQTLAPKMERVVNDPRFRGVLRSLAGPDYMMQPTGHMHISDMEGQAFHKDGTGHGVRTHDNEDFIIMYYPTETSVDMGPTVIIPGSHLFSVDRAGHWTSEDRIQISAIPPNPDRPATQLLATEKEMIALRAQGKADNIAQQAYARNHPVEEQDKGYFEQAAALLGPQFSMVPLVVPAGTVCVVDADLVHRAGRAVADAHWRPMLKLSVRRVSAPVSASWNHDPKVRTIPVDTSASDGAGALWQQHWLQLCGIRSPSTLGADNVDVASLVSKMEDAANERTRQGAAYQLGAAMCTSGATEALLKSFASHPAERVRRASTYGLTRRVSFEALAGGGPATTAVLAMLNGEFVPALGAVSGTPAMIHILAQAAPSKEVLDAFERQWNRTMSEIESHCNAAVSSADPTLISPEDGQKWRYQTDVPIDFYITDRRNSLTELLHAAGSVGCRAVFHADLNLASRAAALILEGLKLTQEPGSMFPSYARVNLVRSASAANLVKLLSSPRNRPSVGPRADSPRQASHAIASKSHAAHADPQFHQDLIAEAIRRGHEAILKAADDEAVTRKLVLKLVEESLGSLCSHSRYRTL